LFVVRDRQNQFLTRSYVTDIRNASDYIPDISDFVLEP